MAFPKDAFNVSIMNTSSALQGSNPCDALSPSSAVISSKLFAYSILIPVALLGNILTLLVIYTNKNMRSTLDYFIVNMAISNLLIPVVALPYQIVKTANKSPVWLVDGIAGEFLCKVVFILVDVSPVVCIYSLVGMSLEPFRAVVCRCRSFRMNSKCRTFLIVSIWLMALIIFSPYFYTFRLYHYDNMPYCVQRWSPAFDHVKAHRTFTTIVLVLVIMIPFFLLTIMYSAILITLTKCLPHYSPQSSAARERRHQTIKNTTIMAFALVIAFGLCWGPYNVVIMLWAFAWDWQPLPSCGWRLFFLCAQYLTYAYSCFCPSISFLFFTKYKRGMKRLFLKLLFMTSHGR